MLDRNRHWLADDGVHVNAAGYTARAGAIARAARHCRRTLANRDQSGKGKKKGLSRTPAG